MPKKIIDITGKQFSDLTVLGLQEVKNGKTYWLCECKCGKKTIIIKGNLISGCTKSCGCRKTNKGTHNMSNDLFYKKYAHIKERCNNKNHKYYKNYGGRGIKCEWNNFEEFKNDMYKSYLKHLKKFGKKQTTIDRIDNNKNYCKENCRWATMKEQANNRRSNHYIRYNNKTMTLTQWSEYLNINYGCLITRLNDLGWDIKKSFEKI